MEERIAIAFEPEEVMALLRVALDEDEKEALRCMKEILLPKLEAIRSRVRCRPAFELDAHKRDVEPPGRSGRR